MAGPDLADLAGLDAALAEGDLDGVRRALLTVDGEERRVLEEELGLEAFTRARLAAARGRRRGKAGKVIVLPGIMGSELDVVDRSGAAHRIWIKILRLVSGGMGDLALTLDGQPTTPGLHVRPAGVHRRTYMPLLLELDQRWEVRPFPFDWRRSIDESADRLATEVQSFAAGEPLHLVAHSMGGLVSRRFMLRHPELWAAMDDRSGHARGGRLVMLGTPNRGSFAIPLMLSGQDKIAPILAKADIGHSLDELLAIVSTFPGIAEMLPSPLVELDGSDHAELFDRARWGALHMEQALLDRARELHRELDAVVDAARLVYVAGYDQPTPFKTRITRPGQFSIGETRDGDGRVPHALGLLEGVATFWVDESHGGLPRNGRVLDAVTDLLQRGDTSVLPRQKPAARALTREPPKAVGASEQIPPEVEILVQKAKARRGGAPTLTPVEEARLENLTFDKYLGSPRDTEPDATVVDTRAEQGTDATPSLSIAIEVAWGDVSRIEADVYCVGHYQGVLPQAAELALDRVVSGIPPGAELVAADVPVGAGDVNRFRRSQLVITRHTRRGLMRGALGDVSFFPWGDARHAERLVAVAGMGPPGEYDLRAQTRLVRDLVIAVWTLPTVHTVCTVLIGAGEGNLSIREAAHGLVRGLSDAAAEVVADPALGGVGSVGAVDKLVIVERERSRAHEIHNALQAELEDGQTSPALQLTLARGVKNRAGGSISREEALALVVESALEAARTTTVGEVTALDPLFDGISAPASVRTWTRERVVGSGAVDPQEASFDLPRYRVVPRAPSTRAGQIPVRLSFADDGRFIRAAAIHEGATVPERLVRIDRTLIDELVERTTDPPADQVEGLCNLLGRLLVPAEFRPVLRRGPSFILDIDRSTARVHWELLVAGGTGDVSEPLSVRLPLARQLRTTYSPAPLSPARPDGTLRVLVIGDPGDPAKHESLPGARSEALRVVELLTGREGIEVTARIGAPTVAREGPLRDVEPAGRLDVLALLLGGDFDLVHYAGHGDFDPLAPDRVGWVFADGLITPGELERVDRVPAMVVANACLTARTSEAVATARRQGDVEPRSEAGLLPSLADEFFRLGVRNYVGTAWEVNDMGATLFAETFYRALLPDAGGSSSFGEAVLAARRALWQKRDLYGPLWAAYQHYGDPTSEARLSRVSPRSG